MAKGLIPISEGRRLCDKYKAPMVVVFAIHGDRENFTVMTYGQTKKLCKLAAAYGKEIAESAFSAAVQVQTEPNDLPEEPTHQIPFKNGVPADYRFMGSD